MMYYENHNETEGDASYTEINQPHELTLEEKDELLFALMDMLKVRVLRAKFDPTFTILVKSE